MKRNYGSLEPFLYTCNCTLFSQCALTEMMVTSLQVYYIFIFNIMSAIVSANNFPKMEVTLRSLEFPGSYRDSL